MATRTERFRARPVQQGGHLGMFLDLVLLVYDVDRPFALLYAMLHRIPLRRALSSQKRDNGVNGIVGSRTRAGDKTGRTPFARYRRGMHCRRSTTCIVLPLIGGEGSGVAYERSMRRHVHGSA